MKDLKRSKEISLISVYAENYLASIVYDSNDPIIGKTLEGIVVSWNPAAEKLYGYTSSEIVGRSISLIYPKKIKNELKKILRQIAKGEKIESFETIRLTKSGQIINVAITVSPIKNAKGEIIGCSDITRDITERKRGEFNQAFLSEASNLLSSSLDYSTTLQSVAKLAIQNIADWCAVDLIETGEKRPNLVAVSHKNAKMVEWARNLRKTLPMDMSAPRGVPQVIRSGVSELYPYLSDEMLEGMVEDKNQLKLIKKIGIRSVMIVPIKSREKNIGAITFVSSTQQNLYDAFSLNLAEDLAMRASFAIENAILYKTAQEELAERIKAEDALRESEHKFRKLINSNIIGVAITDVEGVVYEANKTFLGMIGYSEKDLEENKIQWHNLTPAKWHEEDALAIEQVLHYGEVAPREKEYIRKDGRVLPVLIGTTLLDKKAGRCLTFVLDISEQKEIEQRKDDFISIASHELKTPVTSIKVFTQLLAKRFEKINDQDSIGLMRKMDAQLNKLIILISDLLDVSRIEAGKLELRPEPFLLNEIVEETIDSLKGTTEHRFEYHNGIELPVLGDRERIGQVVTNFLTNAIKYSPKNKRIVISVNKVDKLVKVSVKDFGVGIEKDDQTHIFERFYQAKNSSIQTYPGLGMGLYISSEIIKRHGGKIWVESKKGKGSNFFFTIPLH